MTLSMDTHNKEESRQQSEHTRRAYKICGQRLFALPISFPLDKFTMRNIALVVALAA